MTAAAVLAWPLAAHAQQAAPKPATTATAAQKNDQAVTNKDGVLELSPFVVTTDKDRGYAATNAISGSRVNTPIKDLPIPIQVITSEFIDDIGATDLRKALSYVAGITLQSQNDLENAGRTFGSAYGPGGVNNPEGVTSNPNQVQMKIRGFITNNTLRDGFLRGNGTDSVNIERIEVVEGPNALLYGTGNFGGVVDYLTKQPMDRQKGSASVSYGTNNFKRTTLDVTGPISVKNHLNYRLTGAWEAAETDVDYQKNKHYFIAPSLSWKPTATTLVNFEGEYGKSKQNGYGFHALRAAQGNSSTPVDNDQLEAVSFYWPPGADHRSFNLSGPDTHNIQYQSNMLIKLTQLITRESEYMPEINFLAGYNRSTWSMHTRNSNGQITGPINPGQDGYDLAQTITTLGAANGLGGQAVANGNLQFGTLPYSVVKYTWSQGQQDITRNQERGEFTMRKAMFAGKWYQMEEQILGGYSEIVNDLRLASWATPPGFYSYKSPNDLTPITFGKQGNGKPDPGLYQNDKNNLNKGWDSAYYLNSYFKALKFAGVSDRIILMNGIRKDKNNNSSTDTRITSPGATPTVIGPTRADQVEKKSYQNGIVVKITNELSVYALKSQGFQPNFGTQHNAATGKPVGADTARSKEYGIKFDLFKGKLTGTISHYTVTKTGWTGAPWYAPAPLGHVRFDPNKPIVYNVQWGGFYVTDNAGNPGQAPIQSDAKVVAAWNAANAAGAITPTSPISGKASHPSTSIYLNASKPEGAAYLDAVFKSVFDHNGAWPGWLFMGNSIADLANINNATLDAAGFQNGSENAAYQVINEARGWDGTLMFTPNDNLQVILTASINSSVRQIAGAQYVKYPYPQDRWAAWYYPNGGFGLVGQTLAEAYGDPTDTSTHKQNLYPGDDTPKNSVSMLMKYKFDEHSPLKGLSLGIGGNWRSSRVIFSGITHGAGQAQYNTAGKLLILTAPSQYLINGFAIYNWKDQRGYEQYVQLNVDNLLNDRNIYGLIYQSPLSAKISYGIKF